MDEQRLLEFLKRRRGLLDGVTVTGGEPLLQPKLLRLLEKIRALGYLIKLDTNGTKPQVLKELMQKGLLDYVAMDVKASPEKYDAVTRVKNDMDAIRRSIALLRNGAVAHEFRTTFAPELTAEDVLAAAAMVKGTERYFLQQYRPCKPEDAEPHPPSYVRETAARVEAEIGVCTVRGL